MDDAGKVALLVCGTLLGACRGSAFTAGDASGGAGTAAGTASTTGGTATAGTHAGGVAVGGAVAGGAAAGGASSHAGNESGGGVMSTAGSAEPGSGGDGGAPDLSVPCGPVGWTVASSLGGTPAYAIDGMPSTRWTTNAPREPGQWFEFDFGKPINLQSLELHTELYPLDSPSLVRVDFDAVPVTFAPTAPKPGVLLLQFDGKPVRVARVVASDNGLPVPQFMDQLAWWSIYEVDATCSGP